MYKTLLFIACCSLLGCDSIKENQLDGRTYYVMLEYDNVFQSANPPVRIDSTKKASNKFEFRDGVLYTNGFLRDREYPYEINDGDLVLTIQGQKVKFGMSRKIDDILILHTDIMSSTPKQWILVDENAWNRIDVKIDIYRAITEPEYQKRLH